MTMTFELKYFKGHVWKLNYNEVFVFGSNTTGQHGKGSALVARQRFGAEYGNPSGPQGQSYAIITKDLTAKNPNRSISLHRIEIQILDLIIFAEQRPHKIFLVSKFGSSLAGYSEKEIAKLWDCYRIPDNIVMNEDYAVILKELNPLLELKQYNPWQEDSEIFDL